MSDTTPAPNATPTDTLANKRKRDDDDSSASSEDNSAKRARVKRVYLRVKLSNEYLDEPYESYNDEKSTLEFCLVSTTVPLPPDVMLFLVERNYLNTRIPFTCHYSELRTAYAFLNTRLGAHEGMPGFKNVTTKLVKLMENHFEGLNATVEMCTVPQLRR